ncbi:MAG: Mov34/MPN/PAD-1 family protein, partial [Vicinamibacterales bacterium]
MTLPESVEAAIIAHARRDSPEECCGLLLGRSEDVIDAVALVNAAADPRRRYFIDPRAYLDVLREARRRSLDVIGVYHSHPRSSATPSPTDEAEGFGNFTFVIVGLAAED